MRDDSATYPPLDTLKPVAPDVWIVDGRTIAFGLPWLRHPTRMTVIHSKDGSLFLHSPTTHTASLQREIDALGTVRWIIAPNRVHYWWIPDWHAAYPKAEVWLAPLVRKQAGKRIDFPAHELAAATNYPWSDSIDTLSTPRGRFMTEYEFFHRASRTLVLTDFIEKYELRKVDSRVMRWLVRLGGANGETPRDMRLFYSRAKLRRAVESMIAWDPERIVLAHGRWYERDAVGELERAFGWLFPRP
jgi:hypothetical protein